MNHEELETFGPLKPETYVRIRRCRETAEVDFLTQVDESLVPPFHEGETLMMKKQDHIHVGDLGMFLVDGQLRLKLMGADPF